MNIALREYVNGSLISLNFFILFIIGRQLFVAYKEFGKGWTTQPGIISACALWWIFFADFLRSVLAWSALHVQSFNIAPDFVHVSYFRAGMWLMAGAIAAAGTARLIYALSPVSWGHKGWIIAIVATPVFVFLLSLVPVHSMRW